MLCVKFVLNKKTDFSQRREKSHRKRSPEKQIGLRSGKKEESRKDKIDRTSDSSSTVDLYVKTQFHIAGQGCSRCPLKHNSKQQQQATLGATYMSKQPAACEGAQLHIHSAQGLHELTQALTVCKFTCCSRMHVRCLQHD